MNLRNRILATIGAFMLVGGAAVSNVAQAATSDTGTASVQITSNANDNFLAVTVGDATFTAKPYSFTNQSTSGSLTVTATDTRGTEAGWNVTLDASDFAVGAESFDISNLSLTAGAVSGVLFQGVTGNPAGITATSASPVEETGSGNTTEILSAAVGSGAGQFDLPMTGTLNIPGGTLVGTYLSTVTVSITTGP